MSRTHRKTIYEALGRSPVHPFPARMAPGIALDFVSNLDRRLRILDPMMGSGTALALARAYGHRAIGIDVDPLAVLISKVWTRTIDRPKVRKKAGEVLKRAHREFRSTPIRDAYPVSSDKETRKFIRYWFDIYSRRQLAALARAIQGVRDDATRDVLWCAFSRLIITKQAGASLAKDLAHSRPHKAFDVAPIKPFKHFALAVDRILENSVDLGDKNRGPVPSIRIGDARRLKIATNSIDLVLTSPPYLNAIDYMRCSKFSLVWMGHNVSALRKVRNFSIGTEAGEYDSNVFATQIINQLGLATKLSRHHRAVLARFIEDMRTALEEVARVLVPTGRAIYVVGENTIRGTYIRNSKIITAVARQAGLILQKHTTRKLPPNRRYLPPPSRGDTKAALDTRMRREIVLTFRKPKQPRRANR